MTVCPHCWEVNLHALRLCGRCGADMQLVLQESGGLRRTAAVQSPVPVRVRDRLSVIQRVVVLAFVVLIFLAQLLGALYSSAMQLSPPIGEPEGRRLEPDAAAAGMD